MSLRLNRLQGFPQLDATTATTTIATISLFARWAATIFIFHSCYFFSPFSLILLDGVENLVGRFGG
jgi:hypothetical protein